jgi:pimeloyl-ACP methyl ester carboxylesterase
MSGGSRVAMRIALSYPDLFHGLFLDCGSDPIGDIEAPLPSVELFHQFQESTRVVYFTGQTDSINLSSDEGSRQSMRQWCVFDIYDEMMPFVGHEWASQREFEHALSALENHVPADPERLAACRARIEQELNLKLTQIESLIAIGKFSDALTSLKRLDAHFAGLAAPRSVELARNIASHIEH